MNKTLRNVLIVILLLVFISGSFAGGFLVGHFTTRAAGQPTLPVAGPTASGDAAAPDADVQALFAPFWQTWELVHQYYLEQPVDDLELMQGAIRGMLESLGDQHTSFMDPDELIQMNIQMAGEYDGIGAWVDTSSEYLTIVSPMPGSPAEAAGLHPGDKIIAIDGEDMTGIPGELVIRKVLGPAGTQVVLTIVREGEIAPFDVTVTRAHIVVPSVESEMLDGGIAYVKLNNFGDNTTAELRAALRDLMAQNPQGLILDLRNNGGGYLVPAVEVASQFMNDGVVLYEQYGDGSRQTYDARPGGLALDIPMVVLVNEGTASASEIVAGALQDQGRAQLVGELTYGKGSVQNWIPLDNDQGAVRITIAQWLTPAGRTIHEVGLTPDVTVEMTAEDYDAGLDPQLDSALQVLQQLILNGVPNQ